MYGRDNADRVAAFSQFNQLCSNDLRCKIFSVKNLCFNFLIAVGMRRSFQCGTNHFVKFAGRLMQYKSKPQSGFARYDFSLNGAYSIIANALCRVFDLLDRVVSDSIVTSKHTIHC